MIKVLYIVKLVTQSYYLKSFAFRTTTTNIQNAMRAETREEAQKARDKLCQIPLVWDVVAVEYDTLTGKVIKS